MGRPRAAHTGEDKDRMSKQTAVPGSQGPDARGRGACGAPTCQPTRGGCSTRAEGSGKPRRGGRQKVRPAVHGSWTLAPRAPSVSRGLGYNVLGSGRGCRGRAANCIESWPGRSSVASPSPQPSPNPAWKCGRVLRQPQGCRREGAQPCCREAADSGEAACSADREINKPPRRALNRPPN